MAFDFDLKAVVGAVALLNADELRQALCVPNNPIMSNSCNTIKSDRCRRVIKQISAWNHALF